jgi:hypothetical protein
MTIGEVHGDFWDRRGSMCDNDISSRFILTGIVVVLVIHSLES